MIAIRNVTAQVAIVVTSDVIVGRKIDQKMKEATDSIAPKTAAASNVRAGV